ncbi:MAG: hypothetical protein VB143_04365 [Burkholderia sp.]
MGCNAGLRAGVSHSSGVVALNRLRFFWTRIWGKTCVWKRS